jgi:RNA polymerase sigma factor (sigma-70 family)
MTMNKSADRTSSAPPAFAAPTRSPDGMTETPEEEGDRPLPPTGEPPPPPAGTSPAATAALPDAPLPRHPQEPTTDSLTARWLPHPEVARSICGALRVHGLDWQDVQDGLHEVYVKALAAFHKGAAPPEDLRGLKAFCAAIAKNHAIDALRKSGTRKGDLLGDRDPDEHTAPEDGAGERDAVDARRHLEVLAQLFREGRMPEGGLEILNGVASRCSHEEIARDLGVTPSTVEGRMRMMRDRFLARIAQLGMLSQSLPLCAVMSTRSAKTMLSSAA